jgi:preprotein translocase subunit SecE
MGEAKQLSKKEAKLDVKKETKKDTPGKVSKDVRDTNRIENIKKFLRGVRSELKKVHWIGRSQLIAYTGVVFVSVLTVTLLIWGVDAALSAIMKQLFK